jgi:hypothetical protein
MHEREIIWAPAHRDSPTGCRADANILEGSPCLPREAAFANNPLVSADHNIRVARQY